MEGKKSLLLTVFFNSKNFLDSSGVNLPRGSTNLSFSFLPSARKVSWKLHHDTLYPSGHIAAPLSTLGSDPTCSLHLRFGGCDSCNVGTCQQRRQPKTCEFNQPCPKADDGTTAARLGGNGALVTHMVRNILAKLCKTFFKVMQFGQFVAHSFSMTAQKGDLTQNFQSNQIIPSELDCCNSQNPECFNIDIRLSI